MQDRYYAEVWLVHRQRHADARKLSTYAERWLPHVHVSALEDVAAGGAIAASWIAARQIDVLVLSNGCAEDPTTPPLACAVAPGWLEYLRARHQQPGDAAPPRAVVVHHPRATDVEGGGRGLGTLLAGGAVQAFLAPTDEAAARLRRRLAAAASPLLAPPPVHAVPPHTRVPAGDAAWGARAGLLFVHYECCGGGGGGGAASSSSSRASLSYVLRSVLGWIEQALPREVAPPPLRVLVRASGCDGADGTCGGGIQRARAAAAEVVALAPAGWTVELLPEDAEVAAAMRAARVLLAPDAECDRRGGAPKLELLDALEAGLPAVTDCAASTYFSPAPALVGGAAAIAPGEPEAFAARAATLLSDEGAWAAAAEAARLQAFFEHSWARWEDPLARAIEFSRPPEAPPAASGGGRCEA